MGFNNRVYLNVFQGDSRSKWPIPDPILRVEESRCSIGEVRSVVQVVQIGLQEFHYLPEVRV